MGVFKLKRSLSRTQPFYFTVVSPGNGKTLATSEMYTSKEGALDGMRAMHQALQGRVEYDDETG